MLASSVPDHNKRRNVMADPKDAKKDAAKKGGKFKKAYVAKFGEKYGKKDK